ncbi:MAG: amino acid adenylation domain-containing protein [Fischerella sp. CENA71]|nr:amino acid adenylation domain-containing protein [Fischerella sp. CENA71]
MTDYWKTYDAAKLPLTFTQTKDLKSSHNFHNIFTAFHLTGSLNVAALRQSLNMIVQRHEILRTTFATIHGQSVQIIAPSLTLTLPIVDWCQLSEEEMSVELQKLAIEEVQQPFNLTNKPLLRVTLLRIDEEEHVLLLVMHHTISNSWSVEVFNREIAALYGALDTSLSNLSIKYTDFAYWQCQRLTTQVLANQLTYWKQQLANTSALLEIPTNRPPLTEQTFRKARRSQLLPFQLTESLKALSQQTGVTLLATLLAAFVTLLYRYTNQHDILVGVPITNRNVETKDLIRLFVNTLVLRTRFQGNLTFSELLKQVDETIVAAYDHQDLPFKHLVEELQAPLIQTMLVLEDTSIDRPELSKLTITPIELHNIISKLDLTLVIQDTESGLLLNWEYNTNLFDSTTIERMALNFQTLLESIVTDPQQRVAQLQLLSATEQHQLLVEWNDTSADYPLEQCFPRVFEATVARTPDAVAVVSVDAQSAASRRVNQQLTYQQLNARANRWARYLVEQGVGKETIVALLCDRNIDFLTAMLAVFKAGGAYLPLNPQHPPERIQQVLEQSQAPLVLAASCWASIISSIDIESQLLCLEELDSQEYSSENLPVRCYPENLAYVIYTSGSTGKPKGVMIEHRGMLNHLYAKVTDLQLTKSDVVAQTATQIFDISIWQFLAALLVGGRVEIVCTEIAGDPAQLLSLVQRQQISILEIVPSLLRMILQHIKLNGVAGTELSCLRWLLLTGETLPPQLCRQWFEHYPQIPMMNAYGPTECSDDVTHHPIYVPPQKEVVNLPIGRPVSNTQLYILDSQLQPVPIGVTGELYVGGLGVGRGYLYNSILTEKAFIKNPFTKEAGARLYKTGDKARYLSDGNIEFLGRIDYQVKIRGFRIELGEIEVVLAQHPQVREVVVVAKEEQSGNQYLVAYVVPNQEITTTELRDFLKQKLPEYMIPTAFVLLKSMPLTSNGKVDRHALPAPEFQLCLNANFVAPHTPTQEILAKLWAEVLNLKQIGIYDNFFEMGGNSLLATQVISRLRSLFGVELPLRRLFETPTVGELSELIRACNCAIELQIPKIAPVPRSEYLPLSFAQARLWFLNQLDEKSAIYNMPEPLRILGSLNVAALEMAVQEIIRRHEILRTTFKIVNSFPVSIIASSTTINIPVVDLQHLPEQEQSEQVQQLAIAESQQLFDLSNGPLLRATLLRLEEQSHVLLLTMHHIVSDGWSMGIFVKELSALYQAFDSGKPAELSELSIQYADFAHWQKEWLTGEVLQTQLNYWKQQLASSPPLLELPTDHPRPSIQTFQGSTEYFQLDRELTSQLKTLSHKSGATLFMTLLAVFATLLSRYSGLEDIVIGSPIANRNCSEFESLIGFFVNTLVLRTQLQGNPTFSELLERVREMTLGAYEHQDLPFEKLVEELQPERSLSHTPLFQVMFALQNAPIEKLELPNLTITPFKMESVTAKFDLTLLMEETEAGLTGELVYNKDLFDAATIRQMARHFQLLSEGIVTNPQERVGQLPLLNSAELHQLLVEWNDTQVDYPQDKCIHQLFEEQVERSPDAIAVVFESKQLTYRELNDRANQLAHYLQTLGVKPEVLVGICVERSLEMIVGLLGILKAGGAYVPLDPAYPQDRLSFMLSDSQIPVLLTQEKLVANLPEYAGHMIRLDADWQVISQQSHTNANSHVQPNNLVYVIYTSGSTGQPKGVLVTHQALCNLATSQIRIFHVQSDSRVLQFASFSFDASISEVVMALCAGAQLYLGTRESLLPGSSLTQLLHDQAITHVTFPPSALAAMPPHVDFPDLRTIIVAGEACPPDLVSQWSRGRHFINGYGPTEATVCATTAVCTNGESQLPIGRPIANTQVYILDRYLQPVPIGVPGELHIGGVGLARGYLNRSELTLEKFIPNLFSKENSARLYKTGDLARYLPDGNIEYLGRIDEQVKIRGFRIELGEIEAVLSQHPQIREAVVIVREDKPGNRRLVAYIVPNFEPLSSNELRNLLKEKLAEYMIPSAFIMLESLPLTPNGKVDRKALSVLKQTHTELETTLVLPRTPVEEILADIWIEILGLEQVGIYQNFFELGGHSLLGTQVISRIQDSLEVRLPLRTLFENQTIADLAVSILQCFAEETELKEMDSILAELEKL